MVQTEAVVETAIYIVLLNAVCTMYTSMYTLLQAAFSGSTRARF